MSKIEPKVAIVICNWNKKDFVIRCINSVKALKYLNKDIIVVDNASIDGSIESIKETHKDVVLIENKENKGGSGGFNSGMRYALDVGGYKYIYLLDNDVVLDTEALSFLVTTMEEDSQVGIAGSKVYILDYPNQIQELGAFIDWENLNFRCNLKGVIESKPINETVECDYVAACSLLTRVDVIEKIGLMDESYFLYWDDIQWALRIRKAGYKIKACSSSKVWHKLGGINKTNTMATYYFWRNRMHFFNQYLPDEVWEEKNIWFLKQAFQGVYTSIYYGKKQAARTIYEAIKDCIQGRRGKALENQHGPVDQTWKYHLDLIMTRNNPVYIVETIYTNNIIRILQKRIPDLEIIPIKIIEDVRYGMTLIPCEHVFISDFEETYTENNVYWIDTYLNLLPASIKGLKTKQIFEKRFNKFVNKKIPSYLESLRQIRISE